MSSLAFANEHYAWKQRVGQEATRHFNYYQDEFKSMKNSTGMSNTRSVMQSYYSTTSNRPGNPNQLRNSFFDPAPKFTAIVTPKAPDVTQKQFHTYEYTPQAKTTSAYNRTQGSFNFDRVKEVRGKYARPASNVKNDKEDGRPQFTPRSNTLVSRPSTSGSLSRVVRENDPSRKRGKTFLPKHQSADYDIVKPQTPSRRGSAESIRGVRSSKADVRTPTNRYAWKQETAPVAQEFRGNYDFDDTREDRDQINPQEGEMPVEDQQNVEEDSPMKRPSTSGTWRTGSSQQIYMEELERMIEQERKRRLEAQAEAQRIRERIQYQHEH